ncbi:MAG: hypothetical protein LBE56_12335 [Tannerella sp.]|jgi:hypothetical protein|nr:hypothetical protein [Tannerella sp.]
MINKEVQIGTTDKVEYTVVPFNGATIHLYRFGGKSGFCSPKMTAALGGDAPGLFKAAKADGRVSMYETADDETGEVKIVFGLRGNNQIDGFV